MSRVVKDAVDITTGEKIFFNNSSEAIFMPDGSNVQNKLTESRERLNELEIMNVEAMDVERNTQYVTLEQYNDVMSTINQYLEKI
jgi:hypothetical protein